LPIAFEHLIGQLLEAMNYQNVAVTAPSNDKGVDLLIEYGIGVRTRSVEVLELDADVFAQTEEGEDS
jgi:Restriction endonuclease